MAIPASHIAKVQPRVITGGSNDLELNGLAFTVNPLIPASAMVLEFPSASSVGAYFGLDSDEYKFAVVYFSGYFNRLASPGALFFARRVDEALPAWLRGGSLALTMESLQAVSDGAFVMSFDNLAVTVEGLDFSNARSFSDVAAIIQTGLEKTVPGATCAYSSLTGAFTITGATFGEDASISYASAPAAGTDMARLLALSESSGAVLSQGSKPLNIAEQMRAVRSKTENFVTFTTLWEETTETMLAWAKWANDNYGWLYIPWSTSPDLPVPGVDTDPASVMKRAGYDHVAMVEGSMEYAAFLMGCIASVAWDRINSTVTFAFKRQPGLAPRVSDELSAQTLENKNCNYFGEFATRNARFEFLYPGCLLSSDWLFIDAYVNSVWLNNRIQVALMDGLTTTGRLSFVEGGYTRLRAWLADPVMAGLNNGTIEKGVELSELQKSELAQEAGQDISRELFIYGYFIQILDPGAKVRAKRESPILNLWYTYGGAVHKLDIPSTAVL